MPTIREAKVFIPNKGYHDYSDAKRFGVLQYVTTGVQNKYGVSNMARCWADALSDSNPDDFILQTSLSILTATGVAVFAAKHGRVNFLLWQKDKYIARTIVLDQKEKEYTISEELLYELFNVLSTYSFSDGGYTNNDDVLEVTEKLKKETSRTGGYKDEHTRDCAKGEIK